MLIASALDETQNTAKLANKELIRFLEDHTPWLFARTFDEFYLPYRREQKKLRLAHQPNFLPSIAVVDQFVLGEHLSETYNLSFEYLSMDYDACQNERYRTAYLLKLDQNKLANAKLKLPYKRGLLICKQGAANQKWVAGAKDRIQMCRQTFFDGKLTDGIGDNNDDVSESVDEAFLGATKQVEVNERLIQNFVELSSPIVSGSQRLIESAKSLSSIFCASEDINRLMSEAIDLMGLSRPHHGDFCPMWYVCDDGRRVEVRSKNHGEFEATGSPDSRETVVHFSRSSLVELVEEGKIVPRIVADDLLDAIDGRFDLGIAYISGIEHYVLSAFVAVGLGMRPMPEFFSTIKTLPPQLLGFQTAPRPNMISAHFARDVFRYDPGYAVSSPSNRVAASQRAN